MKRSSLTRSTLVLLALHAPVSHAASSTVETP